MFASCMLPHVNGVLEVSGLTARGQFATK